MESHKQFWMCIFGFLVQVSQQAAIIQWINEWFLSLCMTVEYIYCLNDGCIVVEASLEISASLLGAQSLVQAMVSQF